MCRRSPRVRLVSPPHRCAGDADRGGATPTALQSAPRSSSGTSFTTFAWRRKGRGRGKPAGDGGKDPKGRAGGAGSMQPAATGRGRRPTTAALDGSPRSRHLPKRQTTHLKDSERDRGKTDFKDAAFQTRHLVTVPRWTRGARHPRPCHCSGEAAGSAHSTRPATARAGGPCARLRGRAGSAPAAGAGGMRAPDAAGQTGTQAAPSVQRAREPGMEGPRQPGGRWPGGGRREKTAPEPAWHSRGQPGARAASRRTRRATAPGAWERAGRRAPLCRRRFQRLLIRPCPPQHPREPAEARRRLTAAPPGVSDGASYTAQSAPHVP